MKLIEVGLGVWIVVSSWLLAGDWRLQLEETKQDIEIFRIVHREKPEFGHLLAKPPGDGPFPAIILNHGGRTGAKFLFDYLSFPLNGFVTIASDLRHAEIPWQEFRTLGWKEGKGPGTSEENIHRCQKNVEILKSIEFVDGARIAMYGHSAGGHLTVGFLALGNSMREVRAAAITAAGIYPRHPDRLRDPKRPDRYRKFPQIHLVQAMSVTAEAADEQPQRFMRSFDRAGSETQLQGSLLGVG